MLRFAIASIPTTCSDNCQGQNQPRKANQTTQREPKGTNVGTDTRSLKDLLPQPSRRWLAPATALLLIAATLSWATPARADTGPTLSIGSTSVVRSVTDAVTAYFTVTLSSVQATPVSYDFATADGSAVAGVDYEATSGTKTMQPGATRSKVEVKIYGVGPGHPDPETSKCRRSRSAT